MKRTKLFAAVSVVFLFSMMMTACDSYPGDQTAPDKSAAASDVNVAVDTSALTGTDVLCAEVVVYSSEDAYDALPTPDSDEEFPIEVTMSSTTDGVAPNVPVGTRYFVAEAYDGVADISGNCTGNMIFSGATEATIVVDDDSDSNVNENQVTIVLSETGAHDPFENTAPLITALRISDGQVLLGVETVDLSVEAYDPDPGIDGTCAGLSFMWALTGGGSTTDEDGEGSSVADEDRDGYFTEAVEWTPVEADSYDLTITATDCYGLSTTLEFLDAITVTDVANVDVTLIFDSAPEITNLLAEPGYVGGEPSIVTLDVTVGDEDLTDGDDTTNLTYTWLSGDDIGDDGCIGIYSDEDGVDAMFDLDTSAYTAPGTCALGVNVTDHLGQVSSSLVILQVGPPADDLLHYDDETTK